MVKLQDMLRRDNGLSNRGAQAEEEGQVGFELGRLEEEWCLCQNRETDQRS